MSKQNPLCAASSEMVASFKSICRVTIPSGIKSSPSLSSSHIMTLLLPFSGLPWLLSLRPCFSFTDSPQSAFTPVLICPIKIHFPLLPPKQGLPRSPKMQCWANDRWLHGSEGGRQQKGWENKWWDRVLGLSNNHTSWTEPGRRWIYRLGGGSRWKESRYLFRTGYLIQPKLIYSHMNKFEVTYRVKTTVSNLCQLFPGDIMTL